MYLFASAVFLIIGIATFVIGILEPVKQKPTLVCGEKSEETPRTNRKAKNLKKSDVNENLKGSPQ